jgi:hypothetical protein
MLDKDEMVIERDFGGDMDDGRGNRESGSTGETGRRGKERDSAGSEGRLVGRDRNRASADGGVQARRYEMTGWGDSGAR